MHRSRLLSTFTVLLAALGGVATSARAEDGAPTVRPAAPAVPPAAPAAPATSAPPAPPVAPVAAAPAATTPAAPSSPDVARSPQEVFSDDWWGRARPVVEMHGFFRTRAELFHNFSLGRHNSAFQGNDPQNLWPIPLDQAYTEVTSGTRAHDVAICGTNAPNPNQNCSDKTESGANVRLRLDPEIHISDNLRILSEIDALDNLVLGSTPDAYAQAPSGTTPSGYRSAGTNPYVPIGFFSSTQGPPTAGVNSNTNSIEVKRVWGEYATPLGQIRFGRMPDQWGLGMVDNAGDGIDSDYQTTTDRIMFVTGLKSIDLYFGGAWDFVSTGPTNSTPFDVYGGQPTNVCNLCNVNEWAAFIAHRTDPELQKLSLARGELVLNGGVYTKFRSQNIDVATATGATPQLTPQTIDPTATNNGLEPRQAWALTPDVWVQAIWHKLRFEAEAASIIGQIGWLQGLNQDVGHPVDVRQFGLATQTEYRAVDDKLSLQFGFGYASGDPWANTNGQGALNPSGLQSEYNIYGPISTFRFHPDYRVDLIFFRHILSRVEGAYYFRPSVDYDFMRHPDGEKLGGGAAIIWSRASEFVQTPGHKRDLGVELDLQLYYQSKDGSLNDDPSKVGGFYAMLQYGVFFPLGGLDYLPGGLAPGVDAGTSTAQTVRLFLGIAY
jgi:uncharacterized protein (TIGR04551 family)